MKRVNDFADALFANHRRHDWVRLRVADPSAPLTGCTFDVRRQPVRHRSLRPVALGSGLRRPEYPTGRDLVEH
jgi:hypothetical protein